MASFSTYLTTDLRERPAEPDQASIFVPAVADFPRDYALVALTFPLCSTNRITTEWLKNRSDTAPENCYCGICVLDPFLKWNEFVPLLRASGFKGICNFPPLPDFEEEEQRALVASYYTFENELDRIREFASIEFDILVVCSNEEKLTKARNQLGSVTVKYCLLDDITVLERS